MRLIDADALLDEFREKCVEECACCNEAACRADTKYGHTARLFDHCGLIDRARIVDAIPIDSLKEWMDRACEDDDLPMLYALDRILKRWAREHADGA